VKQLEVDSGQSEQASSSSQRTLKAQGSDATEPDAEPKEPEKMLAQLAQFQKLMVKALQAQEPKSDKDDLEDILTSLKKAGLKTIRVKSTTTKEHRKGLIDSGATNAVREINEEKELQSCHPVNVEVAFKQEITSVLMINE
jgi:hypothetical protein